MSTKIFLIRHGESLKNTLKAYGTKAGREPLTKYGEYQSECIAEYLQSYCDLKQNLCPIIYTATDRRSIATATAISDRIHAELLFRKELVAFVGNESSGKLENELYAEIPSFGSSVSLYRAGLLSAYDVPWPSGNIKVFEDTIRFFYEQELLKNDRLSIVVSHKSVITCLSMLFLKEFNGYPKEHYGYVDIPVGCGLLYEIENNNLNISLLNFQEKRKELKTDVVLRDGLIIFPESACAVCCKEKSLLLVKQDRPRTSTWELPGGKLETLENPVVAAARELFEETGYSASDGKIIYSLDMDFSISFHRTHLVRFDNIDRQIQNEGNATWIPYETVEKMIQDGIISHAPTIVAFLHLISIEGND